jgi:chromosome segregation ATPase
MAMAPDDQRTIGRLTATMEALLDSHKESREEGRRRDTKLDSIEDSLRSMEARTRDQSQATKDQISEMKHAHNQNLQKITGSIDVLEIHVRKVEVQIQESDIILKKLATAQATLSDDVAKVKVDTAALQLPVKQLVRIRQALIAYISVLISITGFAFYFFRPVWDAALDNFLKSIGWK